MNVFLKNIVSGLGLLLAAQSLFGATQPPTTVPLQLINGLPYMEAMINEKGPFLFGFDTGFGAGMELDSDLAATLNILASGETIVGDGSGRNEVTLQTGTVRKLTIGNHSSGNITAILRSNARKNVPGMEKVKGIIGMGLFPEHTITIDYPRQLFIIEKGSLPKANNLDILNFEQVGGGVPKITLKIGNLSLKAVVDSRSMSGEFKVPQEIVEKLTFLASPKLIGKGRTVSNTIDVNEVKIKEAISIGNLVFNEPTITYPSLNENAIIGSRLLQKFAITIDSKNKRIQFVKGIEPKKNEQLIEYAGQFGERTISIQGSFLYIQRPNGMPLKMLPKGKDEFTLETVPNAILLFGRDSKNGIQSIKVSKDGNEWEMADKTN